MTPMLALIPLIAQGGILIFDELYCHRRRGLPTWERWGHPLDTLTVAFCVSWLRWTEPTQANLRLYLAFAAFSCLFVTKDEFVHREHCDGLEHWLHPLAFLSLGWLWWNREGVQVISLQLGILVAWTAFQIIYWSFPRGVRTIRPPTRTPSPPRKIPD